MVLFLCSYKCHTSLDQLYSHVHYVSCFSSPHPYPMTVSLITPSLPLPMCPVLFNWPAVPVLPPLLAGTPHCPTKFQICSLQIFLIVFSVIETPDNAKYN